MAGATYYVQECPTCGRNLQVRIEYLGKRVACRHCSARFEASDPSNSSLPSDSSLSILARADELIKAASESTIWLGSREGSKIA